MDTPWGESESVEYIAPGLLFVSTASHGGYKVAKESLDVFPKEVLDATFNAQGWIGWFEEDVDWAWVALYFSASFPDRAIVAALKILESYKPEVIAENKGVALVCRMHS
jgi:hypothetical protein